MVPDANAGIGFHLAQVPRPTLSQDACSGRRTRRLRPCGLLGCSGGTVTTTMAGSASTGVPATATMATTSPATTSPPETTTTPPLRFLHDAARFAAPAAAGSRGQAWSPHGLVTLPPTCSLTAVRPCFAPARWWSWTRWPGTSLNDSRAGPSSSVATPTGGRLLGEPRAFEGEGGGGGRDPPRPGRDRADGDRGFRRDCSPRLQRDRGGARPEPPCRDPGPHPALTGGLPPPAGVGHPAIGATPEVMGAAWAWGPRSAGCAPGPECPPSLGRSWL